MRPSSAVKRQSIAAWLALRRACQAATSALEGIAFGVGQDDPLSLVHPSSMPIHLTVITVRVTEYWATTSLNSATSQYLKCTGFALNVPPDATIP
jgi:hypothetical protein